MFQMNKVSKQYQGEFALKDVSLTIGKGLNFIVGSSGSGKTTLLKIICGMEQKFEGEVTYNNKSIKELTNQERSYFYNTIFGFVWQDFNLLEDSTVLENVLLPGYLKSNTSKKNAEKILKDLKIYDIAMKKVKYLSGGQKQRVAIARELMKNPQVIIADEPTSALDEKSSKTIMDILRTLSKSRTVIVVTHDTSMIKEQDHVYELDKGELITKPEVPSSKVHEMKMQNTHSLSLANAFRIAKTNIKNKAANFFVGVATLIVASVLLLTTVSGAIDHSSQGEFDTLLKTYGDSLLDIGLYGSFIDAAGSDGQEQDKPNGEVNQDIGGLYDVYANDERVEFISYLKAFNDIKIIVDGKEYSINNSGNTPTINKLVAGKMPMGDGHEVVVPESFVETLGMSAKEVLGKEIMFHGGITVWNNDTPISKDTSTSATIVGVMDTTISYDYEGEVISYTIEDSFFFSQKALEDLTKKVGTDLRDMAFLLRAKTPSDMISLKDELNERGIVPIGRFELVEDMVRLNNQTTEQAGSASIIIAMLSIIVIIAIFLLTGFMRMREYAIYKVSGYNNVNLSIINLAEMVCIASSSIIIMLLTSPLINRVTMNMFDVNVLTTTMLSTGVALILLASFVAYFVTMIAYIKTNITVALKAGDR